MSTLLAPAPPRHRRRHGRALSAAHQPFAGIFASDFDVLSGYRSSYRQKGFPVVPFGSDVWDFRDLPDKPAHLTDAAFRYDWPRIFPGAHQDLGKQLLAAMLNPHHPDMLAVVSRRARPLPFSAARSRISCWAAWLRWLDAQGTSLPEVAQEHCDHYLAEERRRLDGSAAMHRVVLPLRDFSDYWEVLSESYAPGFRPWKMRSARKVVGLKARSGNATPWIPEEVLNPLLLSALFMIEMAPDILAARAEHSRLMEAPLTRQGAQVDARLPGVIAEYRKRRWGLPQARTARAGDDPLHALNLAWLGRQAGLRLTIEGMTPRARGLLREAIEELGVSPLCPLLSSPSMVEGTDGEAHPWRGPFDKRALGVDLQQLVSACAIVILALSGLRASELLEVRRGCIEALEDEDGHQRYRLHSKVIKDKGYGGQPESWMVIGQVAEAVRCLESLIPGEAGDLLLSPQATAPVIGHPTSQRLRLGEMLKRFLLSQPEWAGQAELPAIPQVQGEAWDLKPSQFRRTLARQLAYRPHGTIASKIHLKHVSATITEGYWGAAGESAELFLEEVERESKEARIAKLAGQFAEWEQGEPVSGGAGRKLVEEFALISDELHGFPGTIEQRGRRLNQLLKARAGTLHIGLLNDCHFTDPTKALCLKQRGVTDAEGPLLAACDPARCGNAVVAKEHVPRWEQPLLQIENLLTDRKIPKNERQRLQSEQQRLKRVIAPFQQKGEGQ